MQSWLVKTHRDLSLPASLWPCVGIPPTATKLSGIRQFVRETGKRVLALVGYADAGYQDVDGMLEYVRQILVSRDPQHWLICSGATARGIGEAYAVAKHLGYTTMGIVSTRAIESSVPLSPGVDNVFFVEDSVWGGRLSDKILSPTSTAFVDIADEFIVIGGNGIVRDEILAAFRVGKPISYTQADMNHAVAGSMAARKGLPAPTDFRGSAHAVLSKLFNKID